MFEVLSYSVAYVILLVIRYGKYVAEYVLLSNLKKKRNLRWLIKSYFDCNLVCDMLN